jgi:hypothetical protein
MGGLVIRILLCVIAALWAALSGVVDAVVEHLDGPATATEPAVRVGPVGPVIMIGDSITAEHVEQVKVDLGECTDLLVAIEALSGRGITSTDYARPSAVEVASWYDPGTWLFQIGSNELWGGITPERSTELIDALLAQTEEGDTVIWVNTYFDSDTIPYEVFNDALDAHPGIDVVIDWASAANPSLLRDVVHPTPEGAAVMADLYCEEL